MPEDIDSPISVTKTVYTITDFLEWQRQEGLNLRPYFQRGDVWTPKAKSYLIDTLIRGYPIPIIYLQNKKDRKRISNVRQVVDGQQRLRTILSFIEPECLEDLSERDDFTILRAHNTAFAGMRYLDLPEKVQQTITDTELSVHVLPENLSDRHLLQLFARLNSTGERLNDQELRNAEYHGEFKTIAYQLSYEQLDRWQEWEVFNPRNLAQMKAAELTSELMIATLNGLQSKSKSTIDAVYKRYDDDFPDIIEVTRRLNDGFDFLDHLYRSFQSDREAKKVRTQSWVYTFYLAYDAVMHGRSILGPEVSRPRFEKKIDAVKYLTEKANLLAIRLESGKIPESLSKALRGASSDTKSRQARLDFLFQI